MLRKEEEKERRRNEVGVKRGGFMETKCASQALGHTESRFSNVPNISMLILQEVTNGILNAMAGVSSPNSIVYGKVVFRSF